MGRQGGPGGTRRGVTLVEMLVTVAVLVIIMTVMVQIFQSATGALTAAQTIQDLDNQLKLLDSTIRTDLGNVTAHFTPPLDPNLGYGYFEYIENEFADVQGEDSDDCLRFTANAPPGQPFTGRMWVTQPGNAPNFYNANVQPITITSDVAEIIYFLRNGNLYRRVLLIVPPELQSAIVSSVNNVAYLPSTLPNGVKFMPGSLGGVPVSWQGVNDISAHPAKTGPAGAAYNVAPLAGAFVPQTIVLNTLNSLTNRENRYAAPRFSDDFVNTWNSKFEADGFYDDLNNDKVPDLYPSLYPNVFNAGLVFAPNYTVSNAAALLAFPYIFPGAYTYPQVLNNDQFGWIHSPTPVVNDQAGNTYQFDTNALTYLQNINHNPLDLGDNSSIPDKFSTPTGFFSPLQTWWGFPTWRETLSVNWTDPTRQLNDNVNFTAFGQPAGLSPRPTNTVPVLDPNGQLLPWMSTPGTISQGGPLPNGFDYSVVRRTQQLFSDVNAYKTHESVFLQGTGGNIIDPVWLVSWEDDLVMTNVRSFDVKAYDNAFQGYADLGWGDDLRLYAPYRNLLNFNPQGLTLTAPPYLAQIPQVAQGNNLPPLALPTIWPPLAAGVGYDTYGETFAHEGRIPPITSDLRYDAQFGQANYPLPANNTYNGGNIGDNSAGVSRLRRVWDSWSTDYSVAPSQGLNVNDGQVWGPKTGYPPIYPSYPAPYPPPLRGIQIQIRVADPTNQRVKSLTIRQDFTDKL